MNALHFIIKAGVLPSIALACSLPAISAQEAPRPAAAPAKQVVKAKKKEPTKSDVIRQKLKTITLKEVNLIGLTLSEAVDFMRKSARTLDKAPEAEKGINFQLRGNKGSEVIPDIVLRNVSLQNLLDAITSTASMTYKVEDYAVVISPPEMVK